MAATTSTTTSQLPFHVQSIWRSKVEFLNASRRASRDDKSYLDFFYRIATLKLPERVRKYDSVLRMQSKLRMLHGL